MKKDFDDYFNEVEEQYLDCLDELRDMEKEMANDLVSPEMYEQFQETIKPLTNNYKILSYVKFLLDMPNKKDRIPRYVAQNQKILQHAKTKEQVLEENKQAMNELKEYSEDA